MRRAIIIIRVNKSKEVCRAFHNVSLTLTLENVLEGYCNGKYLRDSTYMIDEREARLDYHIDPFLWGAPSDELLLDITYNPNNSVRVNPEREGGTTMEVLVVKHGIPSVSVTAVSYTHLTLPTNREV